MLFNMRLMKLWNRVGQLFARLPSLVLIYSLKSSTRDSPQRSMRLFRALRVSVTSLVAPPAKLATIGYRTRSCGRRSKQRLKESAAATIAASSLSKPPLASFTTEPFLNLTSFLHLSAFITALCLIICHHNTIGS